MFRIEKSSTWWPVETFLFFHEIWLTWFFCTCTSWRGKEKGDCIAEICFRTYFLFKTQTGDEKDDNNGISDVSAYTPSSERNSKRICSWPADQVIQGSFCYFSLKKVSIYIYVETSETPLLRSFSSLVCVLNKNIYISWKMRVHFKKSLAKLKLKYLPAVSIH